MITKGEIVGALRQCLDPELNANIVDIGLIYGITIGEERSVKITLTMTSPMCPVTSIIMADVQLRVEALKDVGKVELDLVWDPLWNPEMMSDELKYGRM
ncbi:MAG: DUF59 domain-containing protein [Candidatus Micrarchaeota archaeon]|nr:DUF59 domain-containing protein [Candidatus Micrarchaeota archaeon]